MEKKYLAEIIGDSFYEWDGKKVILKAPTGAGKTTFVLNKIIPYYLSMNNKRKVLIICNRTLLKDQYLQNLRRQFGYYDSVYLCDVMTYQELERYISNLLDVTNLFVNYSAVVCDEAHYFYSDSDFNKSTYGLLRAILFAGYSKSMIFMSATTEEIVPIIQHSWKDIYDYFKLVGTEDINGKVDDWQIALSVKYSKITKDIKVVDNLIAEDYSRFNLCYVSDKKELAKVLAASPYKSLVFLDDKKGADEFQKLLLDNRLQKSEIRVINADTKSEAKNSDLVRCLTISRRYPQNVKVLISTSVLDNGISIEDPDVQNIVIVTLSKTSFLQMLGRVRECKDMCKINLIFLQRTREEIASYYTSIVNQSYELERFLNANHGMYTLDCYKSIDMARNMDEGTPSGMIMKKIMDIYPSIPRYMWSAKMQEYIYPIGNGFSYIVNLATVLKIRRTCAELQEQYDLVCEDPLFHIYYQIGWINIANPRITPLIGETDEEKKKPMVEALLKISNFSKEMFVKAKKELVKDFFWDMYPDLKFRDKQSGCSDEKMRNILSDVGLQLIVSQDNGRNLYSVKSITDNADNI